VADRLHRKIETMHARIRILRSQDRLHRRRQDGPSRRNGDKSAFESN
jgi:aromatic ring-opening dioxygenase LigB subunit